MKTKRGSIVVLTAATMAVGAAPAAAETVYGVTGEATPNLVTFDSASPGSIRTSVAISGLPGGRTIAGIDVRPATQRLTVLDSTGQLYTLDELTGALTAVGGQLAQTAGALDIDYNPTVDRLRVAGQPGSAANNGNARVNPNNGALGMVDGDFAYESGVGDPNEGDTPVLAATAYTNSAPSSAYAPNPPSTAQFGIDAGNDVLVRHTNPNAGTLRTIGDLGVDVTPTSASGMDVVTDADGTTNRAYAALGPAASPGFYTVNVTSGAATKVGDFPAGAPVVDIAVAPTPPILVALRDSTLGQQLTFFASNRPQDAGDTAVTISGLPAGVTLTGIDQRPANGALYGLGSDGVLYTVALPSGQANAIAAVTPALSGTAFGFDFNPTVDRIRIVSDTGQNLRVNPDTGAAVVDGTLKQGGTDPFQGVTAAAYTNSVRGATATTLYDIDSATDALKLQAPPNDGVLSDVGPLGQPVSAEDGYDIAPRFNHGFATGDATLGGTNLLAVNVAATAAMPLGAANGGAVVVGRLSGGRQVRGLAAYDVAAVVPTPQNPGTPPAMPPTGTGQPTPTPAAPAKLRTRIAYSRVKRDRRSPFRYVIRGRVVPKGTAADGAFEGGRVTVRAKRAGRTRTLATRRAAVSSTGRFTLRVTVPSKRLKRKGSGVVRLNLRFGGTDALFDSRAFPKARYR